MSDLNIMIASADGGRLYSALEAAVAWAALGKSARVFFQGEAVALLRAPILHDGDEARRGAGQPDLAGLISEAISMGVDLHLCQTGLALAGITMADIAVPVRASGLVGFLATIPQGATTLSY